MFTIVTDSTDFIDYVHDTADMTDIEVEFNPWYETYYLTAETLTATKQLVEWLEDFPRLVWFEQGLN